MCIHHPNIQFNLGAIKDTQEQRHFSPSHPIQILDGTPIPSQSTGIPKEKRPYRGAFDVRGEWRRPCGPGQVRGGGKAVQRRTIIARLELDGWTHDRKC